MQDIWFSPMTSFDNCVAKIVSLTYQRNSILLHQFLYIVREPRSTREIRNYNFKDMFACR